MAHDLIIFDHIALKKIIPDSFKASVPRPENIPPIDCKQYFNDLFIVIIQHVEQIILQCTLLVLILQSGYFPSSTT